MVWYSQTCKSGLPICGDADYGSTPNLFSLTTSMTNCSLPCNAIGLGSKDGNYYVFNRVDGTLIETFPIGTSEDSIFSDGGIIGLAGTTNTTNPEIFVPSYYDLSNSVQGTVVALYPSKSASPWRFDAHGVVDGSVTVIPGAVLFGDVYGYVYAINISNGALLFQTKLQNSVDAGVTSAEGYVFVATSFGPAAGAGLYAFALQAAQSSTTTSTTTSSTTTTTSSTTTIASGGGGGGGFTGGGGGGGGSSKPNITNTTNGFSVNTVAQLNAFTLTLCGIKLNATENYITPTSAGLQINNQVYALTLNTRTQLLGFGPDCSVELVNITYIPIEHTAAFMFFQKTSVATQNDINATNTIKQLNVSFSASANGIINISAGNYTSFVKITSVSAATPNAPTGFTKLSVYNISIGKTLNANDINITANIQCTSSSVKPFILKNNTWSEITQLSLHFNAGSCSLSFTIPADPVIALMQATSTKPATPLKQAGNSTATSTTIKQNATAAKAPNNNTDSGDLLVLVGLAVIGAIIFATSWKGGRSGRPRKSTERKNHANRKNGKSRKNAS